MSNKESEPAENSTHRNSISRRATLKTGGVLATTGIFSGITAGELQPAPTEIQGTTVKQQEGAALNTPPVVMPQDVQNYELKYASRKRNALETLLAHPEVNQLVQRFYGSFDTYDPWPDQDAVGVVGIEDISIEDAGRKGLKKGQHTVTTDGYTVINGLVGRESRELEALKIERPDEQTWTREYSDTETEILEATLSNDEVASLVEGEAWYVGIGKVTSISSYSSEHEKAEVTFPVFIFERGSGGDLLGVDTGIGVSGFGVTDEPTKPEEVIYVEPIEGIDSLDPDADNEFPVSETGRVRESMQELAQRVAVRPVETELQEVSEKMAPLLTRSHGHHSEQAAEAMPNPIEQNNWTVNWESTSTDGLVFSAQFNDKPVFSRAAVSVSLTAYPPHGGRYSVDLFEGPRKRVGGNVMFHDNLGLTGPGVVGLLEAPPLEAHWAGERPQGFRVATHYHTGATTHEEFHAGLRYGPYNYRINWNFFEDGTLTPTYLRNGPGYEMEHGYPVYASMHAFNVTPGSKETDQIKLFDGDEWKQLQEEQYFVAESHNILRLEGTEGQQVEFNLDVDDEVVLLQRHDDEMGVAPRVVDANRERNFWHPVQYVDGESLPGQRMVVWVIRTQHTQEIPYLSGTVPFVNQLDIHTRNYSGKASK